MTTYAKAVRELDARQPERMVPDLSRITALADLLDHPERTYPTIHVTGTNGKTTTARAACSILCAHGLSAGLYTSPHLHSLTERLALCLEPIEEREFAEEWDRLRPYLEEVDRRGPERVTYFEALTALAFLWFADKPVEAAVFEVGMGGVWDATNLIASDVAVLCPIGLDHPELGGSVLQVATEKAGIIKDTTQAVVVREQTSDALRVIESRAKETGSPVLLEGREWGLGPRSLAVRGQQISVRGVHAEYDGFFLPLHGAHQASNAGAAIVAAESLLGRALDEAALREALETLTSPGRMEVVAHDPTTVLDGAHNPDAAKALAAALPEAFTWQRLHLVLGMLKDKDVDAVLASLAALPGLEQVHVAASRSPRALPAEVLADACWRAGLQAKAHGSVEEAVDAARAAAGPDDLVLVTGSLYTVAIAREHLASASDRPTPPPST
jgi:dihydrofolate synthase/folylpolyglutamate synthase